jgi:hypothetical protein
MLWPNRVHSRCCLSGSIPLLSTPPHGNAVTSSSHQEHGSQWPGSSTPEDRVASQRTIAHLGWAHILAHHTTCMGAVRLRMERRAHCDVWRCLPEWKLCKRCNQLWTLNKQLMWVRVSWPNVCTLAQTGRSQTLRVRENSNAPSVASSAPVCAQHGHSPDGAEVPCG